MERLHLSPGLGANGGSPREADGSGWGEVCLGTPPEAAAPDPDKWEKTKGKEDKTL